MFAAWPLVAMASLAGTPAWAQSYPTRPVRLVVPFAPSGGNDLFARLTAQKISEAWKQQVVVDNKPGAGGSLGSDLVAKAAPDGYTLLLGHSGTLAINPSLYEKLPYDPARDFAPIATIATSPLLLVVPAESPFQSVKDLLAAAKGQPGKLNCASSGGGTGSHLSAELLQHLSGVRITHVPYKGTAPAITDLIGKQVDLMFSVIPAAVAAVKAGKLRALAVTSAKRLDMLPDVPTVAEAGVPGFESTLSYGILAPKGTPEAIVAEIHAQIAKVVASPDFKERIAIEGAEPLAGTPSAFAELIRTESAKWSTVIKVSGAKPD